MNKTNDAQLNISDGYKIVPINEGGEALLYPKEKLDFSKHKREKWRLFEIFLAELLGTAMLMLFGCMSLVRWSDPVPPMQPGFVFGTVVATIIVVFGHISSAHLNPAVTVAALMHGMIDSVTAIIYVSSQCIGSIAGFALLKILTPTDGFCTGPDGACSLCVTMPNEAISVASALAIEFLATSFLIYTVCGVWDERNADHTDAVPVKFAMVIAALSIVAGPYTGCSMNPARSLGPAVINGVWKSHWIYWVSPLIAGIVTPFIYRNIFQKGYSESSKNSSNEADTHQAIRTDDASVNARKEDIVNNV